MPKLYTYLNIKPQRLPQAAGPGKAQGESQAAGPSSKGETSSQGAAQSSGPSLKRAKSTSDKTLFTPPERPQVKAERPPITRPKPDAVPPKTFGKPRKILGIPVPFTSKGQKLKAGSDEKIMHLHRNGLKVEDMEPRLERHPDLKQIIEETHPDFDRYGANGKAKAFDLLNSHPAWLSAKAELRNELASVPNGPTATRKMTKGEQAFLTHAFQQLNEDIKARPFHRHGETAITGNKKGEVTQFKHTPGNKSNATPGEGDRYHLHTHPPLKEPFTSSASEDDHKMAARFYARNKTKTYVTNGKDVLHIQPHSLELVKLTPDPKLEEKLGKFPVAFALPPAQKRPYPFANHEAPPEVKPWDKEK